MKREQRDKILAEDFEFLGSTSNEGTTSVDTWKHKTVENILAMCKTEECDSNEIMFLRCTLEELGTAMKYGVKLVYNVEPELMDLLLSISEHQ